MESDVFDRKSTTCPIISDARYHLIIGLTLCWGFIINWWIVTHIETESISNINPWLFFLGYFASCFYGVYLFNKSSKVSLWLLRAIQLNCKNRITRARDGGVFGGNVFNR